MHSPDHALPFPRKFDSTTGKPVFVLPVQTTEEVEASDGRRDDGSDPTYAHDNTAMAYAVRI